MMNYENYENAVQYIIYVCSRILQTDFWWLITICIKYTRFALLCMYINCAIYCCKIKMNAMQLVQKNAIECHKNYLYHLLVQQCPTNNFVFIEYWKPSRVYFWFTPDFQTEMSWQYNQNLFYKKKLSNIFIFPHIECFVREKVCSINFKI